jgi:4-hydroxy-4-methyl-2-oxoglutarate aldolase
VTTPSSFDPLPTAAVCDALMRLYLPVRTAPAGVISVEPEAMVVGPVRPVRHAGSTDLLLEAIDTASRGDVLVVDNDGRRDDACVGDLIAAEARLAGLSAVVVWGLHRDHDRHGGCKRMVRGSDWSV